MSAAEVEASMSDAELDSTMAEYAGMGLGPRSARSHVANAVEHILPDGAAS